MSASKVIKARGLPWSASAEEVLEFFRECNVVGGENGVHFAKGFDHRPSGVCYLEMESDVDVSEALKKDKEKMGRRYIEVFTSTQEEMEEELNRNSMTATSTEFEEDAVVRCRGLPFSATKQEVEKFFEGLAIEDNGVLMVMEFSGRPKGEAFVQFKDGASARTALTRTKGMMGHRYIEVFPSTMEEARRTQMQMTYGGAMPNMRGGGGGGPMRGGGGMRPSPYDRMGGGGGRSGGYGGMRGGGYGAPAPPMPYGMMGGAGPMMPALMGGGGPMGGGRGGGVGGSATLRMRGLPFQVTDQEIAEWFSSVADPVDIFIRYNAEGRPSGEADVTFATEGDAKRAMQKNRHNMQHRYIELFMDRGY